MYKMNLALAFSIQNSITDSSGILQAAKERQQTVGFIFSVITSCRASAYQNHKPNFYQFYFNPKDLCLVIVTRC